MTVRKETKEKAPAPVKKFVVKFEVEGSMMDKDTRISQQSLIDYFEMHFACPKGLKISRIEAEEKTD